MISKNEIDKWNLPAYLLLPPPIPEPPRVINTNVTMSDSSILSDASYRDTQDCTLQQIRRQYGIVDQPVVKRNSKKNQSSESHQMIRDRLQKIQQNLREQMEKLSTSSDDSPEKEANDERPKCNCNQQLVRSEESSKQLFEYIKRQDDHLKRISEQIDELKRMQQNTLQIPTSAPNSPDLISFNQQQQLEVSATSDGKYKVEKRSIQTMTSLMADKASPVWSRAPKSSSPKATKTSNSSIEKMRKELRNSTSQNEKKSTEADDGLYDHIMASINSILVRNGSFESSNASLNRTLTSSSSSRSNRRSSCSNTPPDCWDSHQRCQARKLQVKKCKHSQSVFVCKLCNKFDGEEMEEDEQNREPTRALGSHPKSTHRLDESYNPLYALPDHEASFATRKYLDKYGLTLNKETNRRKTTRLKTSIEPVAEEDESSSTASSTGKVSLRAQFEAKKIREIKSRPKETNLNRILDLDAIRRLPKLT